MALQSITSQSNNVCKQIMSLQQRKTRKTTGLFVLEGVRGVKDAFEAGWTPDYYVVSDSFLNEFNKDQTLKNLLQTDSNGYQVPDGLMKKLAETENPQGIMAVFPQPSHDLNKLLQETNGLWLVLDRIQDPGNLGALIRSAEAAGVSGVFLTKGSTDPYNSKALRAATGAVLHLPVLELSEEDSDCQFLVNAGIQLVGAALEQGEHYAAVVYQMPLALVIGNEANGIDQALLEKVGTRVIIPMKGQLQSLNAAIAGSILMFHIAEVVR